MRKLTNKIISAIKRKPAQTKDLDPRLLAVRKHTMCTREALESLLQLSEYLLEKKIQGDVVECGVCNGGTAALLGSVIGLQSRRLWLYDSFEGMPETTEEDGAEAVEWVGKCVGSESSVKEVLRKCGVPETQTLIRKGWFENTFTAPLPERVALIHIDADWHSSVTLCLDTFYDRIEPGGVVILDDFGYWEGCREAFYDFCVRRNLKPLLERAGAYQAYWIKGKTHNRPAGVSA